MRKLIPVFLGITLLFLFFIPVRAGDFTLIEEHSWTVSPDDWGVLYLDTSGPIPVVVISTYENTSMGVGVLPNHGEVEIWIECGAAASFKITIDNVIELSVGVLTPVTYNEDSYRGVMHNYTINGVWGLADGEGTRIEFGMRVYRYESHGDGSALGLFILLGLVVFLLTVIVFLVRLRQSDSAAPL